MQKTGLKKCCLLLGIYILFLLFTTSCIRVEYTPGAEMLPPLPEDAKILVLYNAEKLPLPRQKLKAAGVISATASTASNTVNDMRNKIMLYARKHGANIILFHSVEYTPDGEARSDQIQNIAAPTWDRVDNTQSNAREFWSTFLYSEANETDIPIYTVKMQAELFFAPDPLIREKSSISHNTLFPPAPAKKEEMKPIQ